MCCICFILKIATKLKNLPKNLQTISSRLEILQQSGAQPSDGIFFFNQLKNSTNQKITKMDVVRMDVSLHHGGQL